MIGHRYQLYERLGAGGMGAVYRATDRLTAQDVALKRVLSQAVSDIDTPSNENDDLRLSLTREFGTLASLRHPHIITVIDYGFDSERQPYFTMNLLKQPRTLTEAGRKASISEKVRILVETLFALAYLHRRGIIHRDLKPANVLVDHQASVKVLDFGLSLGEGVDSVSNLQNQAAGTIAYMAPEVFHQGAITPATDLFAVGIMAYELFLGRYPFNNQNLGLLVNSILNSEPDYRGMDDTLAVVLESLLAKEPANRFQNAEAVIARLCEATQQPIPEESAALRASFLHASQFVGREAELKQLKNALDQSFKGLGSSWLVGGESGVGKSRLLDEIRIRASVRGALILHGQGVAEGGLPYQLWREPLRRLILSTEINDAEASVLKEIVPDIGALLERRIPDSPQLDSKAQQQQLLLTIADLFKRQMQPILLVLEDLQWASESLEPLKQLHKFVAGLPLLIVASYRHDERSDLPAELPEMRVMQLGRLSNEAIGELSASMLGDAGRQPAIVDFLRQETEGNVFMMTEVVRALAEDAGRLTNIGQMPLPQHVFTGELQRLIQRRLLRVPAESLELLKLAAVAGRLLDLHVLQHVAEMKSLDDWLTLCANSAILEIADGQWRFSHDKIRETLLADLTASEQAVSHRKVAEALETEYPNDQQLAMVLTEHWYMAGDIDKTIHYTLLAVEFMLKVGTFKEAEPLLERGIALLNGHADKNTKQAKLLKLQGETNSHLGNYERAAVCYEESLNLARAIGDLALEAGTMVSQASLFEQQGNFTEATAYAIQSLALYRQLEDRQGTAYNLEILGHIVFGQDDFGAAHDYYAKSLALYQDENVQWGICKSLNNLGNVALSQGKLAAARSYYEQSLELVYQLGNRRGVGIRLNNLGNLAYLEQDPLTARDYFEKSLTLCKEIGDRQGVADASTALGDVAVLMGDLIEARRNYEQALALCQEMGHDGDIIINLRNLGWVSAMEGNEQAALQFCRQSLVLSLASDSANMIDVMIGYAHLYLHSRPERSAELLGLLDAHTVADFEIREFRVNPLLAELKQILSAAQLTLALERGKALDIKLVAQELLSDSDAKAMP